MNHRERHHHQPRDDSARGGKTVYGASVGILMLDTRFPRIPGDIGHAATWPFPVLYRVVRGASPEQAVQGAGAELLDAFVDAARELLADGADGIVTNCGFLALFQAALTEQLGAPVAASSLLQWGQVASLLPPGRVPGIVTISAASLSAAHLAACGIPADAAIAGTDQQGTEFSRAILGDEPRLDVAAARADVLGAAERLLHSHPEVGALILECTNMVPYAADLRERFALPVFSIYTLVGWFQAALAPRRFAPWPG